MPEDARKLNLPPECVNKTPSGEIFVKANLQKVKLFVLHIYLFFYILSLTYIHTDIYYNMS